MLFLGQFADILLVAAYSLLFLLEPLIVLLILSLVVLDQHFVLVDLISDGRHPLLGFLTFVLQRLDPLFQDLFLAIDS